MFTTDLNENLDFSKTCRLCLKQTKKLISIFDISNFEIIYSIIINECTGVIIHANDELPKTICFECVKCLNKFYQFRKLVTNSEHQLYDFLNKFLDNLNKNVLIENINNTNEGNSNEQLTVPLTCPVGSEEDPLSLEQVSRLSKVEIVGENVTTINDNQTLTNEPTHNESYFVEEVKKRSFQPIFNYQPYPPQSHLNIHKTANKNLNTFMCNQCGKYFSRLYNLRRHEKFHSGEKPYVCNQCNKGFCQKSDLKKHERIHTGEKPYVCDQCGKSFTRLAYLKTHQQTHEYEEATNNRVQYGKSSNELINKTGEKLYYCNECDKSFIKPYDLKRHKLIHSGEQPFNCDQCGKSFFKMYYLKRHLLVHTGEKPFNCDECGKAFNQSNNLTKHKKVHHDQKFRATTSHFQGEYF